MKWKLPTRSRIESSPVIAEGRVVAATAAGKLYLLDAASGEIVFENDFGGSFMHHPESSMVELSLETVTARYTAWAPKKNNQIIK